MEVQSDGGDVVSSEQLGSTVVDHDLVSVSAGEAAASDIGEGTILSHRYLLTKRMASGGTCDVYQARDLVALGVASGDQSFLAVKLLRADLVEAVGEAGLVLNEALLTRQLNHPSVIKIFDYHCDQSGPTDRHFVTMELVEGETLAELLGRTPGRRLGYWHAMAILEPVASALQAAHENGIVHSDIKPGNILIGHDGQVKIIDFGTARGIKHALKGKPWRKGRQTSHATVEVAEDRPYLAFTHEYACKDVINEAPPAPADDVYSLACVLYEALSGQKPAADNSPGPEASIPLPSDEGIESGDDDVTILDANAPGQDAAAQEDDRRKWRKPRGLNLAQWWVLRKGLSDQKKDRYASVDAFVKAFKKAKKLPVKLMAAAVLIPCLVFGYTGIQERYAAHQTEVETWAQSDMQLVQATQYADLVMQAPVTSLPKVLSDLAGLPGLLRSGVLANAALSNFDRVENHIRDRLAYNALALSAIGVTLEQAETSFKALQRTNAEFVDYGALLKLLSDLSVYYPDSFRLVEMRELVSSAQQAESQALSSQWSTLWDSDLEPERIERLFQTGSRLLVVGVGQEPLTLSEDALSAYENAIKQSALVNNADGDARLKALYKLMGLFADEEMGSVLEKIWVPYTQAVLGKSAPQQVPPSEVAPDIDKSTQQAVLAEQLFFVANVWSDADLMSAKTQLSDALSTVELALASPEAKPLVRALVERIELKISYYKSTDKSVSTQSLSDLRDTLSALL